MEKKEPLVEEEGEDPPVPSEEPNDADENASSPPTREKEKETEVSAEVPAAPIVKAERKAPAPKRWADSGRRYVEADLVDARSFVLAQLEAACASGQIASSTGKMSRHMKAFAIILEERGEKADREARRRRERETRWARAHAASGGSPFARPAPPATVPRDSADARPMASLHRADAETHAGYRALAARKNKTRGERPEPEREFGVPSAMAGDALAIWDLCARHAAFFRLPPRVREVRLRRVRGVGQALFAMFFIFAAAST